MNVALVQKAAAAYSSSGCTLTISMYSNLRLNVGYASATHQAKPITTPGGVAS